MQHLAIAERTLPNHVASRALLHPEQRTAAICSLVVKQRMISARAAVPSQGAECGELSTEGEFELGESFEQRFIVADTAHVYSGAQDVFEVVRILRSVRFRGPWIGDVPAVRCLVPTKAGIFCKPRAARNRPRLPNVSVIHLRSGGTLRRRCLGRWRSHDASVGWPCTRISK